MALKSGFFMSVNGDRKYNADFFAQYFASFIGNGVFPNPSTNLQVISNNDMTVTIRPGKAWINGYILINDDDYILNIDSADGLLSRIDRIVARYDIVDREIRLKVKRGIFASSPVAPILQRDADAYELGLADVYVGKGAVSITQANITDLRLDSELCGIVHGVVDQVDTTTIFNQYLTWQNEKKNEFNADLIDYRNLKQEEIEGMIDDFQGDFLTWFDSVRGILDENAAGNLFNLISDLRDDLDNFSITLPLDVGSYDKVSQWADILIPDITRGKALLEFLLLDEESSLEISKNEQAILVVMEENRFDKNRQVPFDYEQIIFKLGAKTEVGQYLSWVEELLADHRRGVEKLELGLMLESGSSEISTNEYAMDTVMKGEQVEGLIDYRRKFADKEDVDFDIGRLTNSVDLVDNRLTSEVDRLTIEINKKVDK